MVHSYLYYTIIETYYHTTTVFLLQFYTFAALDIYNGKLKQDQLFSIHSSVRSKTGTGRLYRQ